MNSTCTAFTCVSVTTYMVMYMYNSHANMQVYIRAHNLYIIHIIYTYYKLDVCVWRWWLYLKGGGGE